MNIFDVIGYILRAKHKKVTKISILATQVYDIYSLGGMINSMFTLIYQERLFLNIVILWELNGIKPAEKQYIIAIYQINTNSISVQVWTPITMCHDQQMNCTTNIQTEILKDEIVYYDIHRDEGNNIQSLKHSPTAQIIYFCSKSRFVPPRQNERNTQVGRSGHPGGTKR